MKNILVVNAGSSSAKFKFYGKTILEGRVEEIGKDAQLVLGKETTAVHAKTYSEAADIVLFLIKEKPDTIIHRVVHGADLSKPTVITPAILDKLKSLVPLAPLHMPPAIELIEFFNAKIKCKQIACFDTMFHTTMPKYASLYAIPKDLSAKYAIKRYGFHGLAHHAMLLEAQRLAKKKFRRVITCQLGNGASVCAIKDGKSIDTSMGFTPLEGLVMGTRSGDIDPALIAFLCEHEHKSVQDITRILEKESGLKGLSAESDVRKLLARERKGDRVARLALDIFAYRVKKYIGAYIAVLGGVDCIVLSGGVSRSSIMRERILSGLEELGISVDRSLNKKPVPVRFSKGKVQVWAVEVDEQEYMKKLCGM